MSLKTLEPKSLWSHFDNICAIPHPSKHEEKLRLYLLEFAKTHQLNIKTDKVGNIVILKQGTKGRETQKTLVLQAHIDMVPQKNSDKVHDFINDPILPRIVEDWVCATGTTLGADNGIGVAAALAVLEDETFPHGPIECLFTIDEEDGMTGASELDPKIITGNTLINLDSEQEGDIYVGCAGGVDAVFTHPYSLTTIAPDSLSLKISLKGLRGGHSGLDINLGRGNANKLLARMILETAEIEKIKLHSFTGGNLRNAIPREAFTEISISKKNKDQILSTLLNSFQNIKNEYGSKEPNINFECVEIQNSSTYILESEWILNTINACPHGTVSLSADILDLVETSTNLAIVKTLNTNENTGIVKIECFMRSSSDSALMSLANTHKSFFALANFRGEFGNSYSGWKPNMNSLILKIASTIFEEMNKKSPSVKAIHAGLETGYFTKHFPNMDMVSIGPTIKHPHSPDEKVSIPSVANFWEYLTKIISRFE
jgi:dipeptidase D